MLSAFVVATAAVMVACGSGGSSKQKAIVYAHAVNLRAGDVPHATAYGREEEPQSEPARSAGIPGCPPRQPSAVANIRSPMLEGKQYLSVIYSRVVVFDDTPHSALSNFVTSPSLRNCLTHQGIAAGFQEPQHFTMSSPVLPRVASSFVAHAPTVSVFGTPHGHVSFHYYFDTLGFLLGHAEVTLTVSYTEHIPPAQLERHLLSLLYERAQRAKL